MDRNKNNGGGNVVKYSTEESAMTVEEEQTNEQDHIIDQDKLESQGRGRHNIRR